jgi:HPt (histidine-containing phosphotransfer) domain-containing protein
MNDFISKPFDEHKFIRLVAQWLGREAGEGGEVQEETGPVAALYDLSNLEMISRGDRNFIHKMLDLFIGTIPAAVSDMRLALDEDNFVKVGELAHRIKPSVTNLCIASVEEDVRALENMARTGMDKETAGKKLDTITAIMDEVVRSMRLRIREFA